MNPEDKARVEDELTDAQKFFLKSCTAARPELITCLHGEAKMKKSLFSPVIGEPSCHVPSPPPVTQTGVASPRAVKYKKLHVTAQPQASQRQLEQAVAISSQLRRRSHLSASLLNDGRDVHDVHDGTDLSFYAISSPFLSPIDTKKKDSHTHLFPHIQSNQENGK